MVKMVSFGKYSLFGQLDAPEGSIFDRYAAVREGKTEKEKVELRVYKNAVEKSSPLVTRFVHELKLIKQLNHPNIIKVLEAGYRDKRVYFATPLRPSISLEKYVNERSEDFRSKELRLFAEALVDAVARLHEKQFVHRTLRVTSILVDIKHKIPYIADCAALRDLRRKSISEMGVPHLCEVVAAPEQDVEVSGDKRTDVYLLSALLFWLATDFHPLISTTGEQKMKRQDGELQLLTTPSQIGLEHQVPASLEKLIMRGLSVDPKDRFADASQMREYLLSGHEPARAPTEPPPPTPPESMEEKTERKKIIDAINNRVEALQQSEREFATTTDDFSAQEVSRANKRKSRAKLLFVAFLTGAAIVAAILFVFFYGLGGRAWDEIEVASGCVIKFYKVKEQTAKRVGKVLEGTGYWKRRPNSPVAISWEEGRYVLSFRVPQKVVKDVEVQRWHCRFGHVLSLNVFEGCDVGIRLGLSPLEDKGVIRLTARGTERHTYEGNALLCVRPVSKELALAFAQVLKSRGIFTSDSKSAVYLEHEGGKIYLELRLLGDARGSKKVVSSLQQTANLLSLRAAKGKSVVIRMYDETGDNPLLIESSQS